MTGTALKNIEKCNIIVGAAYVLLSLFFWSFPKTLGVTLGAFVMVLNFSLMAYLFKRAFSGEKISKLPFLLNIVKFLLLIAIVYLILRWNLVDKLFFILGTTVILVSLLIVAAVHRETGESDGEVSK